MEHFNQTIITGILTWGIQADEIKKRDGGTFKKYSLGIGTKEKWEVPNGEVEKPMYITVELWEKDAQEAMKYLTKGTQITVIGRLSFQSWKDRNTGEERSKHVIKAEKLIYEKKEIPKEDDNWEVNF